MTTDAQAPALSTPQLDLSSTPPEDVDGGPVLPVAHNDDDGTTDAPATTAETLAGISDGSGSNESEVETTDDAAAATARDLIQSISFATPQNAIQTTLQHLLQLIQQQQRQLDGLVGNCHALQSELLEFKASACDNDAGGKDDGEEDEKRQRLKEELKTELRAEAQAEMQDAQSSLLLHLQSQLAAKSSEETDLGIGERMSSCEGSGRELRDVMERMEKRHVQNMEEMRTRFKVMAHNLGFAEEEEDDDALFDVDVDVDVEDARISDTSLVEADLIAKTQDNTDDDISLDPKQLGGSAGRKDSPLALPSSVDTSARNIDHFSPAAMEGEVASTGAADAHTLMGRSTEAEANTAAVAATAEGNNNAGGASKGDDTDAAVARISKTKEFDRQPMEGEVASTSTADAHTLMGRSTEAESDAAAVAATAEGNNNAGGASKGDDTDAAVARISKTKEFDRQPMEGEVASTSTADAHTLMGRSTEAEADAAAASATAEDNNIAGGASKGDDTDAAVARISKTKEFDRQPKDGSTAVLSPSPPMQTQTLMRSQNMSSSSRRLSIANASKDKLAYNQTLVSRLERLEMSCAELLRCRRMEDDEEKNRNGSHRGADVETGVEQRLGSIENFLHGYIEKVIEQEEGDTTTALSQGAKNVPTARGEEEEKEEGVAASCIIDRQRQLSTILQLHHETTRNSIDESNQRIDSLSEQITSCLTQTSLDAYVSNGLEELGSGEYNATTTVVESIHTLRQKVVGLNDRLEQKNGTKVDAVASSDVLVAISNSSGDDRWNDFKHQVDESLRSLQSNKADVSDISDISKEIEQSERRIMESLGAKCDHHYSSTDESIRQLREDLDSCKEGFDSTDDGSDRDDARLQEALNIIDASQATIKAMEQEMEAMLSKLSDKPDLSQVNSMLEAVEATYRERLAAGHDALQSAIDDIHQSIRQRMTKSEVMTAVTKALEKARLGLVDEKDSLMIGRAPYRCIGCNSIFPGVSNNTASKVNHNALPGSIGSKSFHARRYFHVVRGSGDANGSGSGRSSNSTSISSRRPKRHSASTGRY